MKIDFEFDTPHGVFRDALHFYGDVIPSDIEIELIKQQRLNNWLAIFNSPPVEETLIEETPAQE
jgi:hypothetical protein